MHDLKLCALSWYYHGKKGVSIHSSDGVWRPDSGGIGDNNSAALMTLCRRNSRPLNF